jgi:acetoacetate decarboxylase
MGTGIPIFGAGWFGVRARHGSQEGEYALFMPMTTEQATVGGRETYGEPKKIGAVAIDIDGDQVHAHMERMGFPLAEIRGTFGEPIEIAPRDKTDFYFKLSPSPDGKGFDTEPALVHVHRHEEAREGRAIDGTLELHDSPIDPIADIPVGRMVSLQFAQVATTQHGEVVERVPADDLLPFVHQRYDDLSVLGKKNRS